MLNSHQRCSDSSILCINAKTCTFRYFDEFFQANQLQMIITGVPSWSFFPSLTGLYPGKCGGFRESDENRNSAKRDPGGPDSLIIPSGKHGNASRAHDKASGDSCFLPFRIAVLSVSIAECIDT